MNANNLEKVRIVLDTPPHIVFLFLPILAIIALWFLYLFLICPLIASLLDDGCLLISTLTFMLLISVLFLDWINNRLILTNLKVTRQRGIIGKTVMDIGLTQIQDIKVSFGIGGRIFGFGTLEIESAGTLGRMVLRGIPSPGRVKDIINGRVKVW